jgi:hypothetical protein
MLEWHHILMAAVRAGSPTYEGDIVTAQVVGGGKYATAESSLFLKSWVCVFTPVHHFVPCKVLSDMPFLTLYAILRPSLRLNLRFSGLECAILYYKNFVKNSVFVRLIEGNRTICAL